MPKFNVYLLVPIHQLTFDADNEEDALDKGWDDPYIYEYRKLCVDGPYRLVAEEVEEDDEEIEDDPEILEEILAHEKRKKKEEKEKK